MKFSKLIDDVMEVREDCDTDFCLSAAKEVAKKIPDAQYVEGFFIYDVPYHDDDKLDGEWHGIYNFWFAQIKQRVESVIRRVKAPIIDYVWYHGWNETDDLLIDITAHGFEGDHFLKQNPPYLKGTNIVVLPKSHKFYKRYIAAK